MVSLPTVAPNCSIQFLVSAVVTSTAERTLTTKASLFSSIRSIAAPWRARVVVAGAILLAAGAATLVVEMTEKPINAYARADNRGTPSRGMGEWLLGADFNNFLHKNESFTINWASVGPDPKELQYVAANWRQVLTAEGVYAFVNASYNTGLPGTDVLRQLDFKAWGNYVEGGFAGPVIRAREKNLTLTGLVFEDEQGVIRFVSITGMKEGELARTEGSAPHGGIPKSYGRLVTAVVRNGSTGLVFEDAQGVIRFVTITGVTEGELNRE